MITMRYLFTNGFVRKYGLFCICSFQPVIFDSRGNTDWPLSEDGKAIAGWQESMVSHHLSLSITFVLVCTMHTSMHNHWTLGHFEWLELGLFGLIGLATLGLLTQCRRRADTAPAVTRKPVISDRHWHWRSIPELQLLVLALPLELLWEIAQFPLYTVWHEGDWSHILYGLAHCTLGDLLILLFAYWIVALLKRDRNWYLNTVMPGGVLFTLTGAFYTVYSEIMNVRLKGTWGYTEVMPLIPGVDIGTMPFLQWLLIPPLLLWLMRLVSLYPEHPGNRRIDRPV